MKKFLWIVLCAGLATGTLTAQTLPLSPTEFDPEKHPVAVDIDKTTLTCVSQYVLAHALKACFPSVQQVANVELGVYQQQKALVFEAKNGKSDAESMFIHIPLSRNSKGEYYAGTEAISCTGCKSCRNCACDAGGTCSPVSSSRAPGNTRALAKVQLSTQ